jgi:hydroxymethylbilane synthase
MGCTGGADAGVWCMQIVAAIQGAVPGSRLVSRRYEGGDGLSASEEVPELLVKLRGGELDIVMADVAAIPVALNEELCLTSVLKRGNPFDALVSCADVILEEFPAGAEIDVCSPLTRGQLIYFRPDLRFISGSCDFNVSYTRMLSGRSAGFVLPASMVETLNQQEKVTEVLTSSICMPPAGQGAIGLVVRREDRRSRELAELLNHEPSMNEIRLERSLLEHMSEDKGNVGVLAKIDELGFYINAVRIEPEGLERVERNISGDFGEEDDIVRELAEELRKPSASEDFVPDPV